MNTLLRESKLFRVYCFVWCAFIFGILSLLPFLIMNAADSLRNFPLWAQDFTSAGISLSLVSCVILIFMGFPINREIKARYRWADGQVGHENGEKKSFDFLFTLSRSAFLLFGLYIWGFSLVEPDFAALKLIEVSGKITSVRISDISSFTLDEDPREYQVLSFLLPDEQELRIEQDLRPGTTVFFTYNPKDINQDKLLHAIRTAEQDYLTADEFYNIYHSTEAVSLVEHLGKWFMIVALAIMVIAVEERKKLPRKAKHLHPQTGFLRSLE